MRECKAIRQKSRPLTEVGKIPPIILPVELIACEFHGPLQCLTPCYNCDNLDNCLMFSNDLNGQTSGL